MNQPLAPSLGNALEVAEVMRVLTDGAVGPMAELSAALGGVVLTNAGLAEDIEAGVKMIISAISSGQAAEKFGQMIAAQGGPTRFVEDWRRLLPEATVISEVLAPRDGFIGAINGEALGLCVVGLGGGRQIEGDKIDPSVGLSDVLPMGTRVRRGDAILRIHSAREDGARRAEAQVLAAIEITDVAPEIPPLIYERIS
jgi:thymidine phosphorylase